MTLDDAARARLATLADLMIPAEDGMPAASGAGVAGTGVDHLLSVRPDLADPLAEALDFPPGADPAAVLRGLRPGVLAALGELVAGAYYLDPVVAAKVGYHGRAARPVDGDGDDEEEIAALRRPVVDRGPIYRADPRHQTG